MSCVYGRAAPVAVSGLFVRPKGAACAFSANLSHRSPKLRRSAVICGELANLARRAHSAAWARQYITYDDITHSHTTRTARRKLKRRLLSYHSYLCRGATTQEGMSLRPNFAANCCIAITDLRHRPTVV